jgi:RNA polymerase sigma-70 factor (ECF subfamily)
MALPENAVGRDGDDEPGRRSPGEGAIVARACEGDPAAQEALVRMYTAGIYNLHAKLLRDRHAAQDLTQETFIKVFRGIRSFEPGRSFRAWAFAIAWNIARDHLRRMRRRTIRRTVGAGEDGDSRDLDIEDYRSPGVLDTLLERERAAVVREALSRLDPEKRAILVLKEFEDLSYEEIAELFACGSATARSRVHRARLALRDEIAALRPEWFQSRCPGAGPGRREGPFS